MRSWAMLVLGVSGCVIYRDDGSSWSSSSSTWTAPDEPVGQVQVSWQVGAQGCAAAGVVEIDVDLGGQVTAVDCALGSATVSGPTGSQRLELRGVDADGVVRYAGDAGRVDVRKKDVTVAPTVVLSALPASLDVTWFFANGRLCGSNGVESIELDLFDAQETLQFSATAACEDGWIALDEIEAGSYGLLLLGRDGAGLATWGADLQLEARPGDFASLELELEPQ